MKVCLVAFANFKMVPYIQTYTNACKENGIAYDIIYWDRYGLKEKRTDCKKLFRYEQGLLEHENIAKKFMLMSRYAAFVKKILKKEKYDRVVVLTSLIGVFLEQFLKKHFSGRYIFDIRDFSYEHISWYKRKMENLMKNSALNIISSEGFKMFLPKEECYVDHNCTFKGLSGEKFVKKTKGPLIISFIGFIRYENECKKLLEKIKNDGRFEFHFYGRGETADILKKYCDENNYINVFFFGEYDAEEKEKLIRKSDLLFNAYGDRLELRYALSNKYYESMYYKKPLIVTPETSMDVFSRGTSFAVDYSTDTAQKIVEWYESIEPEEFDRISDEYLKKAISENEQTRKRIIMALAE